MSEFENLHRQLREVAEDHDDLVDMLIDAQERLVIMGRMLLDEAHNKNRLLSLAQIEVLQDIALGLHKPTAKLAELIRNLGG